MIICNNLVTCDRKTIQMFNDETTQRIVIFRIKMSAEMIIHVIKTHGSFYDIFTVGKLFDQFIFAFIVFIMNFSNDFFENVLQGDKSGHFTIFIKNNGDVESRFTHFDQKFRNILVFISKMWLAEIITDIKRLG